MNKKMALLVYPEFCMQEVSSICYLFKWLCEQETVVFSSSMNPVKSEEGMLFQPHKTLAEFCIDDYDCLILPGCSDIIQSLDDEVITEFLRGFKNHPDFVIGAICSGPMHLSKAGLLEGKKFTNSVPEPGNTITRFIEEENFLYQPIVESGNIITAMGLAYNEFAVAVVRKLGYDCPDKVLTGVHENAREEDYRYVMNEQELAEYKRDFANYL